MVSSGVGLIEINDRSNGVASKLANVSTLRSCWNGGQCHDRWLDSQWRESEDG